MEKIETPRHAYLTKSFRFGPQLADEANRVLAALGETHPLQGFEQLSTSVEVTGSAGTILTRTNAMLFKEALGALEQGLVPHVVGGTRQMKAMLRDVDALQSGKPGSQPDFFGFANWDEVLEFVQEPEGENLLPFVNLVQSVGRGALWKAVLECSEEEAGADLILSTAHKSKRPRMGKRSHRR